MKQFLSAFLVFILIICVSCEIDKSKSISQKILVPKIYTLYDTKNLHLIRDTLFLENKKYSGFLYKLYPNNKDTMSVEGFFDGVLHGISKKWYPNRQLLEERHYAKGEKNGSQISYWDNGKKRFQFNALNDKYEGELKEWNIDGQLIHLATYKNGQEDGTQKMWYENGKIRANYVIIKGKRYGLLGTKNCKNVSDSIFVVK